MRKALRIDSIGCFFAFFVVQAVLAPTPIAGQGTVDQSPAPTVHVLAARLMGDESRTRLVIDVSGPIESKAFVMPSPYRAVIELPRLIFDLDEASGQAGRGVVSAYRFGRVAMDKSRIVLDLKGPALIDKTLFLDAVEGQPARLIIDLVMSDEKSFSNAVLSQQLPTGSLPAKPETPFDSTDPSVPVIVLDPGHGGIDTGATAQDGTQEKTIVLDFAKTLATKLEASGRYKVIITRSDDTFISLVERVEIARRHKAGLFISLHADTLRDPFGVRGATVYTLSDKASDEEAALYAEKENKADLIAGVDLSAEPDDVADILVDLTRRETKAFSSQFAKTLIASFRNAAEVNKNPHRSAGFRVLKAADVPSVLLELGYLSSAKDLRMLTSTGWRDRASEAVRLSVDAFFKEKARKGPQIEDGLALSGNGRRAR